MKDHNAFALAGQCRVNQFARERSARIGQNEDDEFELAALRLVDCQSVRKFKLGVRVL